MAKACALVTKKLPYENLGKKMKATMIIRDISMERAATVMYMSVPTLYSRIRHPGRFSMKEVCQFCATFHIELTDLLSDD